jgi:hypothetical protein
MATTKQATAQEVGRILAETLRSEPLVEGIWVDEHRGDIELWVVTAPLDDDEAGDRLYQAGTRLRLTFPGLRLTLHVINPANWEPDTRFFGTVISASARQIELT